MIDMNPIPGRLKICSVMIEPPIRIGICSPIMVTTGIMVFLSACRATTSDSLSPFDHAVLM